MGVKWFLENYPRRIFEEAGDAGGGGILKDPLPITFTLHYAFVAVAVCVSSFSSDF